jgi:hypothetical protein
MTMCPSYQNSNAINNDNKDKGKSDTDTVLID